MTIRDPARQNPDRFLFSRVVVYAGREILSDSGAVYDRDNLKNECRGKTA